MIEKKTLPGNEQGLKATYAIRYWIVPDKSCCKDHLELSNPTMAQIYAFKHWKGDIHLLETIPLCALQSARIIKENSLQSSSKVREGLGNILFETLRL